MIFKYHPYDKISYVSNQAIVFKYHTCQIKAWYSNITHMIKHHSYQIKAWYPNIIHMIKYHTYKAKQGMIFKLSNITHIINGSAQRAHLIRRVHWLNCKKRSSYSYLIHSRKPSFTKASFFHAQEYPTISPGHHQC